MPDSVDILPSAPYITLCLVYHIVCRERMKIIEAARHDYDIMHTEQIWNLTISGTSLNGFLGPLLMAPNLLIQHRIHNFLLLHH